MRIKGNALLFRELSITNADVLQIKKKKKLSKNETKELIIFPQMNETTQKKKVNARKTKGHQRERRERSRADKVAVNEQNNKLICRKINSRRMLSFPPPQTGGEEKT